MTATATRHTTARVLATLALTLVTLATGVLTTAAPADAWMRIGQKGRPGKVVVGQPMAIDEYDGYVMYLTWRSQRGPLVYRSPATRGPQNVLGSYVVQEWTPSFGWTNTTTQTTRVFRIPAGQSAVRLPELYRAPTTQRGYFRVAYVFAWSNARTGRSLGQTVALPNLSTDHRCVTSFRACETGPGWIRTGRLRTHGGGW